MLIAASVPRRKEKRSTSSSATNILAATTSQRELDPLTVKCRIFEQDVCYPLGVYTQAAATDSEQVQLLHEYTDYVDSGSKPARPQ